MEQDREQFDNEIKLGYGIGDLRFGLSMDDVEEIMGEPEEVEESDEEDEFEHKAWNYWDSGFSFYFDKEDDYRLSCIETANPNVTLFGKKIFEMSQQEVEQLFKEQGVQNVEKEKIENNVTCLSFEQEMIDLYFEEGKLLAVNFGVHMDDNLEVLWPEEGK
ncbi:hypothetical protein ACD591_07930 [Rufibacter glacialis]|uniref:Uncharacterized protein n=1 Tax=Rufibacter glacialis TaxID=1259555 RepID=A0A5M8QC53_9BACT|nr:hypothetical protein [Rufibacter glacialis]KAA6433559.1 hypothetical protein FOE74_13955 [Rufibacter glacialis]GGK73080.1 hypothetical protein GCM10011405_21480 [Rufibacter glacialis]